MRIEDYALIGDGRTAALVGRNGSIDWLCWPNFASDACFASLLGSGKDGFWRLAPEGEVTKTSRRYEPHTLILETTYTTATGTLQVQEFMPLGQTHSQIVRLVKGLQGQVVMRSVLALRFSYGQTIPWVTHIQGGIRAVAGPDLVELHTPVPMKGEHLETVCTFTVSEGESVPFVLTYGTYGDYGERTVGEAINVQQAYDGTRDWWTEWAGKCTYQGPYREMVERSLITLRALTFEITGGIVAAPTTSLPEDLGGVRNWDYRYCWLRDTTFTLLALINGGYHDEARKWMRWLHRTIAGSPDQMQIMYGISGERTLTEREIKSLPGYENSSPVRIGNAAAEQLQLDTFGEVMDAFFWTYSALEDQHLSADFELLQKLIEHLETVWQQPDEGIWEVRGGPKHFTYSKVMAWVAFDRAIKIAERGKLNAPLDRWKKTRDTIHNQVCSKGFNQQRNSFIQHYDTDQLDASVLLMSMVGFLPPDDSRIQGTVTAIQQHLTEDGLVMRYDTSKANDGLPGSEGKFLACSFWLVTNLKLVGRDDEAKLLFEKLLSFATDTGLLSEEYNTHGKRLVGNFPQAFSHIALIGAAYHLAEAGNNRHSAGLVVSEEVISVARKSHGKSQETIR